MGRCYGFCQENCGYRNCTCSCHDAPERALPKLEEKKMPASNSKIKDLRSKIDAEIKASAKAIIDILEAEDEETRRLILLEVGKKVTLCYLCKDR